MIPSSLRKRLLEDRPSISPPSEVGGHRRPHMLNVIKTERPALMTSLPLNLEDPESATTDDQAEEENDNKHSQQLPHNQHMASNSEGLDEKAKEIHDDDDQDNEDDSEEIQPFQLCYKVWLICLYRGIVCHQPKNWEDRVVRAGLHLRDAFEGPHFFGRAFAHAQGYVKDVKMIFMQPFDQSLDILFIGIATVAMSADLFLSFGRSSTTHGFRFLTIMFKVSYSQPLRPLLPLVYRGDLFKVSKTVLMTLGRLGALAILLVIVISFYSLIGVRIFATSSMERAALSLFVLLTTENYPQCMDPALDISEWTIVYFWSFFCIAVVLIMSAVVATFIDSYKATICTQAVLERKEQMKTCLLAFDLLAEKIEVVSEEQNCEEKLRIVNAVSKATLKNMAKHVNAHIAKNQLREPKKGKRLKLFCDSACDVVTTVDGEDDAFSTEKNFVRFCRLVIECSHLTRQHSNGSGSKDGQYKTDGQYKVPQNNSDANSNSSFYIISH
eukprot:jgi/Bigna1/66636/fgenesh1_pg.2_\